MEKLVQEVNENDVQDVQDGSAPSHCPGITRNIVGENNIDEFNSFISLLEPF